MAESPAVPKGAFKVWLTGFRDVVMRHNPHMTKYQQIRIANGVSLYSAGGGEAGKVLIVALRGRTEDLCAPTSMVLQYFPDEGYDLLVLGDVQRVGFTSGIVGYAPSLAAAAARVRSDIAPGRYRATRCFGVSSGGAPALLVGALLDAARVVSICGRPPSRSLEYGKTRGALDLEEALRGCSLDPIRASAVYGAGHRVDAANARLLARLVNLSLIPVPDRTEHAILEPLDRVGRLADFFRTVGLLD